MIVLSRNKGEGIVLGKDGEIIVTLVEIRGDKIRLGIEADKEIPIHRREVYDAVINYHRHELDKYLNAGDASGARNYLSENTIYTASKMQKDLLRSLEGKEGKSLDNQVGDSE